MFFSLHVTALYGLSGLLAFAIPNALGLVLFGVVLTMRRDGRDLRQFAEDTIRRYGSVFMLYQLVAVSLTLFALAAYLFRPLGLPSPLFLAGAVLLAAILAADRLGLRRLCLLQSVILAAMVPVYIVLQMAMPSNAAVLSGALPYDNAFFSLLIPMTLGLLLGPWFDLQQWQRAVAMSEAGGSVAKGFALSGGLFLVLLIANGLLIVGLDPALLAVAETHPFSLDVSGLLAGHLVQSASGVAIVAFALWCLAGLFTTLDSSRLAMRWMMVVQNDRKLGPLFSMLPDGLLTTTVPFFLAAAAVATIAYFAGFTLQYFMLFFGSLFVSFSAVLVLEVLTGRNMATRQNAFFTGLLSLCLLAAGYLGQSPGLVAVAPFVALLGLLGGDHSPVAGLLASTRPAVGDNLAGNAEPVPGTAVPAAQTGPVAAVSRIVAERSRAADTVTPETAPLIGDMGAVDEKLAPTDGWFDERWFNMKLISTYNDTNSVGNVYFANYIGWVGKVRELFFRRCMPDFDLEKTNFFILTRNISHKFVRETKEFQELFVRIRVGGFNRKFVTLQHEIRDEGDNLIGQGEQTLMFVRSEDYGLVDVPSAVIASFTTAMPEEHLRDLV